MFIFRFYDTSEPGEALRKENRLPRGDTGASRDGLF
jgi:hypothetical protein